MTVAREAACSSISKLLSVTIQIFTVAVSKMLVSIHNVLSEGYLYALHSTTAAVVSKAFTENRVWSSPCDSNGHIYVVSGRIIYVHSSDEDVHALASIA